MVEKIVLAAAGHKFAVVSLDRPPKHVQVVCFPSELHCFDTRHVIRSRAQSETHLSCEV